MIGEIDFALLGQYFDAETGLHYNYFRDYDPSIGRYTQSDPIGLDGGWNTYLYVDANPLSFIDPLGLAKVCCRLINDFLVGTVFRARHCYIVADDGTKQSLFGDLQRKNVGVKSLDDIRDSGGICEECTGDCSQNGCFRKVHDSYPDPSEYDPAFGPNSNTYAATLARACCSNGIPNNLLSAPGANASRPRPVK